jgi:hypothetical protein
MSIAKIITDKYGNMVKVNHRQFYMPKIESIEPGENSYSFVVKHRNLVDKFIVWGGKKSGGHSHEWYCDWPNGRTVKCSSMVDALKMLNGM